ncbi:helix-turn-helix domain-containing protein [Streptantibioticus parmotrematis]|uniref:TetR/AcrR family transcriptional regulator n=1 Tax=Streptantibioticus parmotrematis TaxID=2873249 RepID=UPI0033ECB4F0
MTADRSDEPTSRSRQKRVGEALRRDTRNRLLEAAEGEFTAHGYTRTTVTRIAASAGVSVQTLYLAWGSKRELLRGYLESALAGDAASPEDAITRFTGLSPRERLAELADLVTEIAERAATGWRLYRDASAVDPDIAADWDELQLLRHRLIARVFEDIPATALADGLTPKAAVDTAWTIASPDSHDLLVRRLGYAPGEFRDWMEQTLTAAVLAPDSGADATM